MKKRSSRFNYLICIYLLGIAFFTCFRIAETVAYGVKAEVSPFGGEYARALWIGFLFDTAVSGYVLALPLLMMIVGEMARIKKRWYYAIAHYTAMVLYTVCFFACAADIPYFCFFFNRLDAVVLAWSDSPDTVVSMIFGDPEYVAYLIAFVVVSVGWWLLGRLIYRRVLVAHLDEHLPYVWAIPLAVVLVGLLLIGMRGLDKRPLNVRHAYFCNDPFLNQIGLNPVFTFEKSLAERNKEENRPVELTDEATAQAVVEEMKSTPPHTALAELPQLDEGTNVVVVLMESMTVRKTALHDPATSLTPCLDSLMDCSLTFADIWSAGIHTYNGIYSTLYSHPAILARHTMNHINIPAMCGLPQTLHDAGYSTTFFITHKADFDNLCAFLPKNGFDRVVSLPDYPADEPRGAYGIPDHLLFDHALEHCDSIAHRGPFLTCILTCSDHSPFLYPDGISLKPRHREMNKKMVEYADWSIGRFMQMAAKREWFHNTLFVFVADHGEALEPVYEMALNYNHIPLLLHAPGRIAPNRMQRLGLQIDVAPTVLGLMGLAPPDNILGLGIDLLRYERPYAYFSADDKIGVVDGELFYLYRAKQDGRESLYRYKDRSTEDLIDQYPARAAAMRRYAFGMIQTSQQMLLNGETGCH
ncbi:MAG: LTA synthase family protein [Bacteroidales bacterium]|nr:LTA synthase family protein [Bacteroidales bacterium]